MTDILAFLIAIPVTIELIAAAYGLLDLARHRRLLVRVAIRLLALMAVSAALIRWLGTPFLVGMCTYGVLFVLKHHVVRGLGLRRRLETDETRGTRESG